jgi:hypothetical protein
VTHGNHADRLRHAGRDAEVLREVVERTQRQDSERRIRVRDRRGDRANGSVSTSGHDHTHPPRYRTAGQGCQGVSAADCDGDVQARGGERVLHLPQCRMLVVARAASCASGRVQQHAHRFGYARRLSV